MDLNQHLGAIVENLIGDITANVLSQVETVITNAVNARLSTYNFEPHIKEAASEAFEKKVNLYQIDNRKLEGRIAERITQTIDSIQANTTEKINQAVSNSIKNTNFDLAMQGAVGHIIADRMRDHVFPNNSIHASAINFENYTISGDLIQGGIVTQFSSSGIDDRASQVALTILDEATVVENNLLTRDLTVEGTVTVNGNLIINGSVPEDSKFYTDLVNNSTTTTLSRLDNTLFNNYSTTIFNKIREDGLDLNKITINGREVINDNSLSNSITESNLQKLGQLRELQVSGESLLAQTLYVSGKRVGVNTIEPSGALSVWDDEVEIVLVKRKKDTGSFGTPRNQSLILTSNNKDNIVLDPDGSARIDDLRMGDMRFSTSNEPPRHVSERGHVVFNNNPNPGGPMGWICLGSANWANFGIID
jgi:hypothetical protein